MRRYAEGANVVVAPDLLDVFPDAKSVDDALRALAPILRRAKPADAVPPRLRTSGIWSVGKDSTSLQRTGWLMPLNGAGHATVTLELKAGQISLHSAWILHGSEPNTSHRRRCRLALRYLSSDVRFFRSWNGHSVVRRE